MKGPRDRRILGGADDPEIAAHVAEMQQKARNETVSPVSAAIGTAVGNAVVILVCAMVAVALLAAFVGLYRLATWLLGAL